MSKLNSPEPTTEGSLIQQTLLRMPVDVTVTAVAADNSDFQTRNARDSSRGQGVEYVVGLDMPESASRWAEEAVTKLSAPRVEPGRWDVVLHPLAEDASLGCQSSPAWEPSGEALFREEYVKVKVEE